MQLYVFLSFLFFFFFLKACFFPLKPVFFLREGKGGEEGIAWDGLQRLDVRGTFIYCWCIKMTSSWVFFFFGFGSWRARQFLPTCYWYNYLEPWVVSVWLTHRALCRMLLFFFLSFFFFFGGGGGGRQSCQYKILVEFLYFFFFFLLIFPKKTDGVFSFKET